jgi:hypothetical protein
VAFETPHGGLGGGQPAQFVAALGNSALQLTARFRSIGAHLATAHGLSTTRGVSQWKGSCLEASETDINTAPAALSSNLHPNSTQSLTATSTPHSSHLSKNQPTKPFQQSKWFPSSLSLPSSSPASPLLPPPVATAVVTPTSRPSNARRTRRSSAATTREGLPASPLPSAPATSWAVSFQFFACAVCFIDGFRRYLHERCSSLLPNVQQLQRKLLHSFPILFWANNSTGPDRFGQRRPHLGLQLLPPQRRCLVNDFLRPVLRVPGG